VKLKAKSKAIASMLITLFFVATAWATEEHPAEGTINAVKHSEKKINISHGPIEGLGMGAMTMDFAVYDPAMLDDVKAGNAVKFMVTQEENGMLTITDIEVTGTANKSPASSEHEHHHNY
jgi:Cu/Ag efflux protein CusF